LTEGWIDGKDVMQNSKVAPVDNESLDPVFGRERRTSMQEAPTACTIQPEKVLQDNVCHESCGRVDDELHEAVVVTQYAGKEVGDKVPLSFIPRVVKEKLGLL
jgi:hypothetical protein